MLAETERTDTPHLENNLPADVFLESLGRKVRFCRNEKGISRKLLAKQSGVSERYLANVEHGEGNISILLLKKVASALQVPINNLLDPLVPDQQ